jgi:hypothetical protein
LNDIQDISRGLKETIIDENNPSYNESCRQEDAFRVRLEFTCVLNEQTVKINSKPTP